MLPSMCRNDRVISLQCTVVDHPVLKDVLEVGCSSLYVAHIVSSTQSEPCKRNTPGRLEVGSISLCTAFTVSAADIGVLVNRKRRLSASVAMAFASSASTIVMISTRAGRVFCIRIWIAWMPDLSGAVGSGSGSEHNRSWYEELGRTSSRAAIS